MKFYPSFDNGAYSEHVLPNKAPISSLIRQTRRAKFGSCYHIPLKAPRENGYDVVMASRMVGILPPVEVDETQSENIRQISSDEFWKSCRDSLERSLRCFTGAGIDLPVKD